MGRGKHKGYENYMTLTVAFDIPLRPAMLEIRKKGGDPMKNSEISEVAEA
jgi:hypothetical protein